MEDSHPHADAGSGPVLLLNGFESGGAFLKLDPPLQIEPRRVEGVSGLWAFEDPDLAIIARGSTPDGLLQSVRDDLAWIWSDYARRPDAELTGKARRVKRAMLNRVVRRG